MNSKKVFLDRNQIKIIWEFKLDYIPYDNGVIMKLLERFRDVFSRSLLGCRLSVLLSTILISKEDLLSLFLFAGSHRVKIKLCRIILRSSLTRAIFIHQVHPTEHKYSSLKRRIGACAWLAITRRQIGSPLIISIIYQ